MTKGKIVLELVKYAKSAVRKFRPIRGEASFQSHMTRMEVSDWGIPAKKNFKLHGDLIIAQCNVCRRTASHYRQVGQVECRP